MTWVKQRKGWRMNCDVGEVTERLENEPQARQKSELARLSHGLAAQRSRGNLQITFHEEIHSVYRRDANHTVSDEDFNVSL